LTAIDIFQFVISPALRTHHSVWNDTGVFSNHGYCLYRSLCCSTSHSLYSHFFISYSLSYHFFLKSILNSSLVHLNQSSSFIKETSAFEASAISNFAFQYSRLLLSVVLFGNSKFALLSSISNFILPSAHLNHPVFGASFAHSPQNVPALLALIDRITPNRFAVSLCATIGLFPAYTRSS